MPEREVVLSTGCMQIQIRWGEVEKSEALGTHVTEQIEHAMRHHGDRFTRVDVHLHDDNAGKGGANDKRCTIEARPAGFDPFVVEGTGDDFYKTVAETAKKLERTARQFVERHRQH